MTGRVHANVASKRAASQRSFKRDTQLAFDLEHSRLAGAEDL